ncbi:MAG: Wzz/FepE/Etk N-terminal domain-containing protein, partial [SAR324 cluster bacterium]|nr:Wzz/FepE/Etk N-terminal domain-containing protein [SAR324 cluster bacterium]
MPKTDSKPTSENEQTQSTQTFQYAIPYPQKLEDDTIDLYGLWITLWNKKGLVIAVTVIAALGSVVYALQQTPVYKAEALLLPPKAKDVQSLNAKGVQVVEVVEVEQGVQVVQGVKEQAFAAFKNNLSSRRLQKKFIDEQGLMDILAP